MEPNINKFIKAVIMLKEASRSLNYEVLVSIEITPRFYAGLMDIYYSTEIRQRSILFFVSVEGEMTVAGVKIKKEGR